MSFNRTVFSKNLLAAAGLLLVITTALSNNGGQMAFAAGSAANLAAATGLQTGDIVSTSLGTSSQTGVAIQTTPAGSFPTEGNSFAVLSTGCAADVLLPNNEENHTCGDNGPSTALDGLNTSQGRDMVQLSMVLNVPTGATAVSFDWKFYSDEFKEFVNTDFNDAFLAELGSSTFTLSGNQVTAPNNVAVDQNGDLISINTSGNLAMSLAEASGTTYDGATPALTTSAAIPSSSSTITLIFSIFDMGDDIYDTTIFLDNIHFNTDGGGTTTKKASNLECFVPETADKGSTIQVLAILKDASTLDPISGATINWSVAPGGPTPSSTTNATGAAEIQIDLSGLAAGLYTVTASFAGNDIYQKNSCEKPLEIKGEGQAPTYNLKLLEGGSLSDLVVDLNQEVEASASTDNPDVTKITFSWVDPNGNNAKTTDVTPSSGSASDTFKPDQPGQWTVTADFGNGQSITKTLNISFNVIPESAFGVLALLGSSLAALGGFVGIRRWMGKA